MISIHQQESQMQWNHYHSIKIKMGISFPRKWKTDPPGKYLPCPAFFGKKSASLRLPSGWRDISIPILTAWFSFTPWKISIHITGWLWIEVNPMKVDILSSLLTFLDAVFPFCYQVKPPFNVAISLHWDFLTYLIHYKVPIMVKDTTSYFASKFKWLVNHIIFSLLSIHTILSLFSAMPACNIWSRH